MTSGVAASVGCARTLKEKRMSKIPLLLAIVSFGTIFTSSTWAIEKQAHSFLADRHVARGVTCVSCHGESATGKMQLDSDRHEACVACHGWYDAVAEKTVPKDPEDMNPHSQHDGNLPCSECHKGHKQSVNYCSNCHFWTFNVP